ncbi:efflux RND transporter periplasmic adaptor subunit [Henriciella algicola]|uniref:Efflux RND transporter periplasmic adaptor subunit n=1 Tax=Henriciella algicola TaxID=1608422 RepID=A0A399RK51_9PROT|nr:efflux RND transporter periplasmic adaptor subunit [Henriciella algicola]RIJ31051.1 efflux RND transporter periplasmic adaptor subunit [Henriciella algicola]
MTNPLIPIVLLMAMLVPLSACDEGDSSSAAAVHGAEDSETGHDEHSDNEVLEPDTDHGDHIELNAEAAEAAGIQLSVAEAGAISTLLELPAEIRFDADRIARVSPQIEGLVAQLHAGEGDQVQAGSTLARLNSRELAGLKADYLNALSAEELAKARLQREENLWNQQITSEADVQSARAAFSAAHAAREAAENRLHAVGVGHGTLDRLDEASDGALAHAYVTAPIAGTVIKRGVAVGETVSVDGEPMFIILDDSVVWADIAVYKEDLGKVDEGQRVTLRQHGSLLADGQISTVLPVIDETSRTATARVIVDNSSGKLKPGQFVNAEIETGERRSVIRVPSRAIVSVEDRQSVFVPTKDGFEPRSVETGASAGGYSEILSGLRAGETFVSDGAFTLKAQLEKDAFGDGHAH